MAKTESRRLHKYTCFRTLLLDLIEDKKSQEGTFSVNRLAEKIEVSPSQLKMVLSGKRRLSGDGLLRIASAFNFNFSEKEFLEALVRENQSRSLDERAFYKKRLRALQREQKTSVRRMGKNLSLMEWYFPVLLLYLIDVEKIAEKGLSHVDKSKVCGLFGLSRPAFDEAIKSFEDAKLLEIQSDDKVHVCLDNIGTRVKRQEYIGKVLDEMRERLRNDFADPKNYFSADTLSVSSELLPALIEDYKNLVSEYIAKDFSDPENVKVLQVSFQALSFD